MSLLKNLHAETLTKGIIRSKYKILAGLTFAALFAIAILFVGTFQDILLVAGLMALAVIPMIYKRYLRIGIGIEFMLFSTVITGVKYGTVAGFVFGATAMIISDLINALIGEWTLLNALAMGAGGIIAGLLAGKTSILIIGIAAVAAVEIIRQTPPFLLLGPREKFFAAVYALTHLAFNIWLFLTIAPLLGFK